MYKYMIVIKKLPSYEFVRSYQYRDLDSFVHDLYYDLHPYDNEEYVIEIRSKKPKETASRSDL